MQTGKTFGRKLRAIRKKKGLSQKALADMLFVTRKCIGNWEVGIRKPDLEMLDKISRTLNISVSELVGKSGKSSDYLTSHNSDKSGMPGAIQGSVPGSVILVEDKPDLKDKYSSMISQVINNNRLDIFSSAVDSYSHATTSGVSTAFIDAELSNENAFVLAQKLIDLNPKANIIFITENPDNAYKALEMFCSGLILKPLTKQKITDQIEHLRYPAC